MRPPGSGVIPLKLKHVQFLERIIHFLCKLKVYYFQQLACVPCFEKDKSSVLPHVKYHSFNIHQNAVFLCLICSISSLVLHLSFHMKFVFFRICNTCIVHFILRNLVTLILFLNGTNYNTSHFAGLITQLRESTFQKS